MKNIEYTTGDLISPWADVKMDVHEIPFEENSFDVVICNHVLEHVEDAHKVMTEFYRVMKVGGWGIFQVPIDSNNPKTEEDPTITDPKKENVILARRSCKTFWIRLWKRLEAAGFKVTEDDFIHQLDPKLVERYALPRGEILYFCQKV